MHLSNIRFYDYTCRLKRKNKENMLVQMHTFKECSCENSSGKNSTAKKFIIEEEDNNESDFEEEQRKKRRKLTIKS